MLKLSLIKKFRVTRWKKLSVSPKMKRNSLNRIMPKEMSTPILPWEIPQGIVGQVDRDRHAWGIHVKLPVFTEPRKPSDRDSEGAVV